MEQEAASKIKYAKHHALRIAKAIKAGEDPNASNPAPEPAPVSIQSVLESTDPDLQKLDSSDHPSQSQLRPHQPSVEDVPDEHDLLQPDVAQHSALDTSIHPSGAISRQDHTHQGDFAENQGPPSPPDSGETYYHNAAAGDVSPIVSPAQSTQNGGYFPMVPGDSTAVPSLPQIPPDDLQSASFPPQPSPAQIMPPPQSLSGNVLHSFPPPPSESTSVHREASAPRPYASQPPPVPLNPQKAPTQPPPGQSRPLPSAAPIPIDTPRATSTGSDYVADEEAILKAQKHARWAISALNFEDVNTAVKELRGALEALGA